MAAKLLTKLVIESTKSRTRRSRDAGGGQKPCRRPKAHRLRPHRRLAERQELLVHHARLMSPFTRQGTHRVAWHLLRNLV